MALFWAAAMTWADDPARRRCASSRIVVSPAVQGLDVPVAARAPPNTPGGSIQYPNRVSRIPRPGFSWRWNLLS